MQELTSSHSGSNTACSTLLSRSSATPELKSLSQVSNPAALSKIKHRSLTSSRLLHQLHYRNTTQHRLSSRRQIPRWSSGHVRHWSIRRCRYHEVRPPTMGLPRLHDGLHRLHRPGDHAERQRRLHYALHDTLLRKHLLSNDCSAVSAHHQSNRYTSCKLTFHTVAACAAWASTANAAAASSSVASAAAPSSPSSSARQQTHMIPRVLALPASATAARLSPWWSR